MNNLMHKILEALKNKLEQQLDEDKIYISLSKNCKQVANYEGLIILSPSKIKVVKKLPGYSLMRYENILTAEIFERASENAENKISSLISKVKSGLQNSQLEITDENLVRLKSLEINDCSYEFNKNPKNAEKTTMLICVEIFQNHSEE